MNTHADTKHEHKSQSDANGESQEQSSSESIFQFVDNRSETVAQRKLQEMVSNSQHVSQASAFQAISNNHSGYSMDDVRVHHNSDKPAQLQALAYAQPTFAIQRRAKYSGYEGDCTVAVIASFRNFEAKEEISANDALTELQVSNGLVKMDQRSEFFGEYDLKNYQQVGLLYYQIKRQVKDSENSKHEQKLVRNDKPFKEKEQLEAETFGKAKIASLNITGFYKLALLGKGSSIGYYLSSLGKSYDHKHTIVIGKENPWKSKRGIVPFINHPMGMIEPWGKKAPKSQFETRKDERATHEPENVFASRTGFAQKTEEAIVDTKAYIVDARVKTVSKIIDLDDPTLVKMLNSGTSGFNYEKLWKALKWRLKKNNFRLSDYVIETDKGFYVAKKVVMGTGGGPHSLPNHAKTENVDDERNDSTDERKKLTIKQQVMDMDAFMRLSKKDVAGKNVVVQGTNAAIDAADRAIADGGNLVAWLGSKPPFLYKTLLKNAPSTQVEQKRVSADRNSEKISIQQDGTLKISFTIKQGESTSVSSPVTADYFVYGIGQDINAEDPESDTSGPAAMLSKEALEELKTDEAVIKGDAAGAFDNTYGLGLHIGNKDQGLTVIGASAWRLSGRDTRDKLDKMASVVPSNVVSYEQLGAIKSSTGAMNSYMPEYIGTGFNWLTADSNMIVAYLTIQHPGTSEAVADGFVKAVKQLRRLYPNGVPESVKQSLLTREIKSVMASQMALETAIFMRENASLSEGEMESMLKSTLFFLLPDKAKHVTKNKVNYSTYIQLKPDLENWLESVLPNEVIAKKKSL